MTKNNQVIVSDKIAKLMSTGDRKALGILLPGEREARHDVKDEKTLQRLCESELNRRGIVYLHLSFRAREKIGWPDLTFVIGGIPYAIELKTATGTLSPGQKEMLRRMNKNGWYVDICRSFEEFIEIITSK